MAANSKPRSSNDTALPPELAAAEATLGRHDKLAAVLAETSSNIPQSLAEEQRLYRELGSAEISGDGVERLRTGLTAAQDRRAADVRRRQAASDGLLALADELRAARQAVEQTRSELAKEALRDFAARWEEACLKLSELRAEAGVLSGALRITVATPPPYMASIGVVSGNPEVRPVSGPIPSVTLPPALAGVGAVVDRLDAAGGLLAAIAQAKDLTSRHIALSRTRAGMTPTMPGVYSVLRGFDYCGSHFKAGLLVSRDLIPDGVLYRLQLGRTVALVDAGAMAAA